MYSETSIYSGYNYGTSHFDHKFTYYAGIMLTALRDLLCSSNAGIICPGPMAYLTPPMAYLTPPMAYHIPPMAYCTPPIYGLLYPTYGLSYPTHGLPLGTGTLCFFLEPIMLCSSSQFCSSCHNTYYACIICSNLKDSAHTLPYPTYGLPYPTHGLPHPTYGLPYPYCTPPMAYPTPPMVYRTPPIAYCTPPMAYPTPPMLLRSIGLVLEIAFATGLRLEVHQIVELLSCDN